MNKELKTAILDAFDHTTMYSSSYHNPDRHPVTEYSLKTNRVSIVVNAVDNITRRRLDLTVRLDAGWRTIYTATANISATRLAVQPAGAALTAKEQHILDIYIKCCEIARRHDMENGTNPLQNCITTVRNAFCENADNER